MHLECDWQRRGPIEDNPFLKATSKDSPLGLMGFSALTGK
ncbi:hypothetical protein BN2476_1580008 [Paraburkholderia piptadeniae]|uniref:Uncharacterized protein n=1 Tax=Paraburkholderia piptadeniae TaxID=1701573 RepID=A0A1N7SX57_9BURK|nr:hypothetical protein BN2476_1580008 [Paraburkholderia piptadeniae]